MYLVKVGEKYLSRGSLKTNPENATFYPHPSSAQRAMENYIATLQPVEKIEIISTK